MKKLILPLFLLLLTSCASYQSYIDSDQFGKLVLPKDAKFDSLVFTKIDTNGSKITLLISNATFIMNPAVIDAETARLLAIIQSIQAGMAKAATSAAIP